MGDRRRGYRRCGIGDPDGTGALDGTSDLGGTGGTDESGGSEKRDRPRHGGLEQSMRNEQKAERENRQRAGRRLPLGIAVLVLALSFTGCGNSIPLMDKVQEQAVSEYAALLLLKYDANSRSRLVDLALYPEEPETPPEAEQEAETGTEEQGMEPTADTPVTEAAPEEVIAGNIASMEAFYQLPEGMSFAFLGTQTCQSYLPEGETSDYFALDADAGKSLLILEYRLSNQSGAEQTVDLLGRGAVIRVTVNGEHTEFAQTTMLMNDLSTYKGTIPSGESVDLALIVELDQETAENVTSLSISLKKDGDEYAAPLLDEAFFN